MGMQIASRVVRHLELLIIRKMGRNPVLLGRLYIAFFGLLPPWGWLTRCDESVALSAGQLPLQIFQPCTHSVLL